MELNIRTDMEDLFEGIHLFASELKFVLSEHGIPVQVEKRPGHIEVSLSERIGTIRFGEKSHFFRALGLWLEHAREQVEFHIVERPQFDKIGVMFDTSRNGVMTVESVKRMLFRMALMGLNTMLLYMEDTYEIEALPYFGYMRGRYSNQELRACDDFADMFGIEVVPCIQTLAHLSQALKWNGFRDIADTEDILLVDDPRTYDVIEQMICAASAPFRTRRIHIGMDEPYHLGLGNYLKKNGYTSRFEIISKHLKQVVQITDKYGLKPMIWSDLYLAAASPKGEYWDPDGDIPQQVLDDVPAGLQVVYWDYHHRDQTFIEQYILKHQNFGFDTVFAGGIVTWFGPAPNYGVSMLTANAALNACKQTGLKEMFVCIWHDDGTECNDFSALLGLQVYAEHGFTDHVPEEKLQKRFEFCTGMKYEAFADIRLIDEIPGVRDWMTDDSNPAKFLLWQDVLGGLFDSHIEGLSIAEHYTALETRMRKHRENNGDEHLIFDVFEKLCAVLRIKSEIGLQITECYRDKNAAALETIVQAVLPELQTNIIALRNAHRKQWFRTYKSFGWEVLDIRYGGLAMRVTAAVERIREYLNGEIVVIQELEQERLKYDIPQCERGERLGLFPKYKNMVTVSTVF